MIYDVIRKTDLTKAYEYGADAPIEWVDFPFSEFDHVVRPESPVVEQLPIPADRWKIWVGSFFDRFGAYKIPILASADLEVQACIKDASVRKYIDLLGRREELALMIALLQSKGFDLDPVAILDLEPTTDEVWNG